MLEHAPMSLSEAQLLMLSGVVDDIKDWATHIDDNFVELFFDRGLYLHMTTVMAVVNLMILSVGLFSDRMVVASNQVEGGEEAGNNAARSAHPTRLYPVRGRR